MKKIDKIKDRIEKSKLWNTDIGRPDVKSRSASFLICGIIVLFSCIFLLMSIIGAVTIKWLLQTFLSLVIQNENVLWLLYGLLFGTSFSFLVAAIPRPNDVQSPKMILYSSMHYLSYFFAFFLTILIIGNIVTYGAIFRHII